MKINCMIVDDEPAALDILKHYIADDARLELAAVCSNALQANELLASKKIDLLFLDINMPKLSGLTFYKSLSKAPAVIFTTAYPEYAVEGFEVDAVDYLLKPFSFERFLKAVNKFVEKSNSAQNNEQDFILLYADKKMYKTNLNEIYYLEARADYVNVCLKNKQLLVHDTLSQLLKKLPANKFQRIHKSYVVALDKFDYIEGNMLIINNKNLPIGNTYRDAFLKNIKPS